MGLKVITAPTGPLIPIDELLTHLKDEGAGQIRQAEVLAFLDAALVFAQHHCQSSFGSQTLELALNAFPPCAIDLPMGPVTSITSIKYLDINGVEQTLDPANYTLNDYGITHQAVLGYNLQWPSTRVITNAVKVRYVAGAAALPTAVRNALLLYITHLDSNRSAVEITTGSGVEVPMAVRDLLSTKKDWTL